MRREGRGGGEGAESRKIYLHDICVATSWIKRAGSSDSQEDLHPFLFFICILCKADQGYKAVFWPGQSWQEEKGDSFMLALDIVKEI